MAMEFSEVIAPLLSIGPKAGQVFQMLQRWMSLPFKLIAPAKLEMIVGETRLLAHPTSARQPRMKT